MLNVEVDASAFEKACGRAMGAVNTGSSLSSLGGLLLRAERRPDGGHLVITAYDLEIGLVVDLPAKVETEGSALVEAKLLAAAAARMPEATLAIDGRARNRLGLKSGTVDCELVGLSADEAPAIPDIRATASVKIPLPVLLGLVTAVESSISADTTKYNQCGAFLEVDGDTIRLTSTNGHTLAHATAKLHVAATKKIAGVIVPAKAIATLKRSFTGDTEEIALGISENSLTARGQSVALVVRLIDGEFPAYQSILGDGPDGRVTVGRLRFSEALRRAAVIGSVVDIRITKNEITLTVTDADAGRSVERIVCEASRVGRVYASVPYLTAAVDALGGETIELRFGDDEFAAAHFRTAGSDERIRLVMPMRPPEETAAKAA